MIVDEHKCKCRETRWSNFPHCYTVCSVNDSLLVVQRIPTTISSDHDKMTSRKGRLNPFDSDTSDHSPNDSGWSSDEEIDEYEDISVCETEDTSEDGT